MATVDQIRRYPATNVVVGAARPRVDARRNRSTTGTTVGNIMALIIATHPPTNATREIDIGVMDTLIVWLVVMLPAIWTDHHQPAAASAIRTPGTSELSVKDRRTGAMRLTEPAKSPIVPPVNVLSSEEYTSFNPFVSREITLYCIAAITHRRGGNQFGSPREVP